MRSFQSEFGQATSGGVQGTGGSLGAKPHRLGAGASPRARFRNEPLVACFSGGLRIDFGQTVLSDAMTLAISIFSLRGVAIFWCLTGAYGGVKAGKWGQFIGARFALSSRETYVRAIPRNTVVGQAL